MADRYTNKQKAFRLCFGNEMGKEVLADLRTFCHATKSSFSSDALEMARNEGRREVFNRILTFIKVDFEDVYNMNEEYGDE